MAVGGYGDFAAGREGAAVKLPQGQRVRAIVRPDLLIDPARDPLIVSSLHPCKRSGSVGSSLQGRAPIAKEGVGSSNPLFRSSLVRKCMARTSERLATGRPCAWTL